VSSIGHEPAQLSLDERALLALEDAMLLAIRWRDAAGIAALLTDDFLLLVGDGTQVARGPFVEAASSIPGEILELAVEHLRARVVGGVGILAGLQTARVRLPDGTEVTEVQTFTDVCVRTAAGWRMALAHSTVMGGEAAPAQS
jgi:ketosteroid isomerase-like protein